MKVKFDLLYKSGQQDTIIQKVTSDELLELNKNIQMLMLDKDSSGMLTFETGIENFLVRGGSVDRVKVTLVNEE